MDVTPEKAREWVTLFPRHPAFWLLVALGLVFVLTRRPPPAPPAATQTAAVAAFSRPFIDYAARRGHYAWLTSREMARYAPLADRLRPPPGFRRADAPPGGFADWLRHLPCAPPDAPVRDGRGKAIRPANDPALAAVIDLRPGGPRLLHAANMVIRLRAEYLWHAGRIAEASFHFTSGAEFPWRRFAAGERPTIRGRTVTWKPAAPPGQSRETFTAYLETLFPYSSTISLAHDLRPASSGRVQAGDVFIAGQRPGHAVLVLDVAADDAGSVRALLGEGGAPPQTFHVLRAADGSAWFALDPEKPIDIPTWPPLPWRGWRRFPDEPATSPSPSTAPS